MRDNAEIADVIRAHRRQKKWSQRMLEDRADLGRGYLSILESGGMKSRPKLSTLMKIASALRVPLVAITGDMEEDTPRRGRAGYGHGGEDTEGEIEVFTLLRESHPEMFEVLRRVATEAIEEDQARRRRWNNRARGAATKGVERLEASEKSEKSEKSETSEGSSESEGT